MRRILLTIVAFATILLLCSACSQEQNKDSVDCLDINLNDYVTISYDIEKYNIVAKIDYNELNKAFAEKDKLLFENFTREFGDLEKYIKATVNMQADAKNGDEADVIWEIDKSILAIIQSRLNINLLHADSKHIITDLPDIVEFNPFDYLSYDTLNVSNGQGAVSIRLRINVRGVDVDWEIEHDGVNGSLSNGDIVHAKLKDAQSCIDFAKNHRLSITATEADVELYCFENIVRDEKIMYYLNGSHIQMLDAIVEQWVLSGLNDSSLNSHMREYEIVDYVYYPPKTQDDTDGMLVAIYKILDPLVPPYYVYFGLKGQFTIAGSILRYNGSEFFPDHFISYEKEKSRYSNDFGWAEDTEEMSFMYNDQNYAGKPNIKETIVYLDKIYGEQYAPRCNGLKLINILNKQ